MDRNDWPIKQPSPSKMPFCLRYHISNWSTVMVPPHPVTFSCLYWFCRPTPSLVGQQCIFSCWIRASVCGLSFRRSIWTNEKLMDSNLLHRCSFSQTNWLQISSPNWSREWDSNPRCLYSSLRKKRSRHWCHHGLNLTAYKYKSISKKETGAGGRNCTVLNSLTGRGITSNVSPANW